MITMNNFERLRPRTVLNEHEILIKSLECTKPLRFAVAASLKELEAVYRLRYQVVSERARGQVEDFPDGLERDGYDSRSVHIVGWNGDRLAASTRIVLPAPGCLLPVEEAFDVSIAPPGQTAEIGRSIVARAYSTIHHHVFKALLVKAALEAWALGMTHLCGTHTRSMIRLERMMGCRFTLVGDKKPYWGEERYPYVFSLEEIAARVAERWYREMSENQIQSGR
jgi:N-acyl-L-homoserine lactone synthetase